MILWLNDVKKGQLFQTVGRWSALGRRRQCNSVHGSGWHVGAATANSHPIHALDLGSKMISVDSNMDMAIL